MNTLVNISVTITRKSMTDLGTGDGFTSDGRIMASQNGKLWLLKPCSPMNKTYTVDYVEVIGVGRNTDLNPTFEELPDHVKDVLNHHNKEYRQKADSLEGVM